MNYDGLTGPSVEMRVEEDVIGGYWMNPIRDDSLRQVYEDPQVLYAKANFDFLYLYIYAI